MILFAETGWPTMIALGLMALLVGMMLFRVQRYYARNPSSSSPAGSRSGAEHGEVARSLRERDAGHGVTRQPDRHQLGVAREMAEWEVQIARLSPAR